MAQVAGTDFEPCAFAISTDDNCTRQELLGDGAFVAVDIGRLAHHQTRQQLQLADIKGCNSCTSPRLSKVVKSLSRKGSLRNGERSSNINAQATTGTATTPQGDADSARADNGTEKLPLVIRVAVDKEINDAPHQATTPTTMSSGGVRPRRLSNGRRSPWLPWLDPARRVLLVFATLSSMGTLLLLYFTLSLCMDKNMPVADLTAG